MKLYGPLHVCAYLFGVLPAVADTGRFRVHWPGLTLKAFHTVFYWLVSLVVGITTIQNLQHYQKIAKKILTTRVLDIDELYVYMMFASMASTAACQAHMLWPSVTRAINECFFHLCQSQDDVTGAWQSCTAFSIVLFIAYEFAMYYLLITYKLVVAA